MASPETPLTLRLAAAAATLGWVLVACAPARPPNLVLVVLDTTRADHLTPYGYALDTTPELAAFADEAVLFERAYSTSSWTLPAHASLFTGLLPVSHQATQETQHLDDAFDILAELLSDAGYETALFSGNAWLGEHGNLDDAFDILAELLSDAGYETALFSGNAWLGEHGNLDQGFEHTALITATRNRGLHANRAVQTSRPRCATTRGRWPPIGGGCARRASGPRSSSGARTGATSSSTGRRTPRSAATWSTSAATAPGAWRGS